MISRLCEHRRLICAGAAGGAPHEDVDDVVADAVDQCGGLLFRHMVEARAGEGEAFRSVILHLGGEVDLEDGAPAAGVGFQKGDIIMAVNNQKIAKTSDLDKAAKASSRLWRIIVVRGGQQINVTLGG